MKKFIILFLAIVIVFNSVSIKYAEAQERIAITASIVGAAGAFNAIGTYKLAQLASLALGGLGAAVVADNKDLILEHARETWATADETTRQAINSAWQSAEAAGNYTVEVSQGILDMLNQSVANLHSRLTRTRDVEVVPGNTHNMHYNLQLAPNRFTSNVRLNADYRLIVLYGGVWGAASQHQFSITRFQDGRAHYHLPGFGHTWTVDITDPFPSLAYDFQLSFGQVVATLRNLERSFFVVPTATISQELVRLNGEMDTLVTTQEVVGQSINIPVNDFGATWAGQPIVWNPSGTGAWVGADGIPIPNININDIVWDFPIGLDWDIPVIPPVNPPVNPPVVPPLDPPAIGLDFSPLEMALDTVRRKFPFSIPWDLAAQLAVFNVEPTAPSVEIDFTMAPGATEDAKIELSLERFDSIATAVRWLLNIAVTIGLILMLRRLLPE